MPKYRSVVVAAACAAALAVPASAAYAASAPRPTAATHVLTIKSLGGTAVAPGAVLSASVVKKTDVTFSTSLFTLKCAASTVTAKVTSNPAVPGTAEESITAETIGSCSVNFPGLSVKSIKAEDLPWVGTVSGAKGLPVTVSGSSKSKIIKLLVDVSYKGSPFSCIYGAKELKGSASSKASEFSFTKQAFSSQKGSNELCPATSDGSASYGPVTDTSAKNATVFVN